MLRRLFWLTVGIAIGVGGSVWTMLRVRRTVERFSPSRVRAELGHSVRSIQSDLVAAIDEGRAQMRAREAQLRAELRARPVDRAHAVTHRRGAPAAGMLGGRPRGRR